jgi:peptide deformylase
MNTNTNKNIELKQIKKEDREPLDNLIVENEENGFVINKKLNTNNNSVKTKNEIICDDIEIKKIDNSNNNNIYKNNKKSSPKRLIILASLLTLFVLISSFNFGYNKIDENFKYDDNSKKIIKLSDNFINITCKRVNDIEIGNSRYMNKIYNFDYLNYSMDYYMKSKGYDGICAIDFDIPLCFCKLNTKYNQIVDIFNLNITGFSESSVLNEESSHFCPKKENIFVKRYNRIWAEYHLINGDKMEKIFTDVDSYIIQYMLDISNGINTCDNKIENDWKYKLLKNNLANNN